MSIITKNSDKLMIEKRNNNSIKKKINDCKKETSILKKK